MNNGSSTDVMEQFRRWHADAYQYDPFEVDNSTLEQRFDEWQMNSFGLQQTVKMRYKSGSYRMVIPVNYVPDWVKEQLEQEQTVDVVTKPLFGDVLVDFNGVK